MNIGVFDSGLGGLTIFKELLKILPQYNYIYFGDNARVPYGGRSADLIYHFTKDAVDFLFKHDCQLIILACNAATSNALRRLQQEYLPQNYPERRILGVIRPVVEIAATQQVQTVGVMATRATVNSQSYPQEIKKLSPQTQVFQEACPLLVPIIEEDEMDWEGCDLAIQKYLQPLLAKHINSLILGCTHFGLIEAKIKENIQRLLSSRPSEYSELVEKSPSSSEKTDITSEISHSTCNDKTNIQIISQGKATAERLADYLLRHSEIQAKLGQQSQRTYYATDLNQRYEKLTRLFLGDHFTEDAKLQLVNI